MLKELNSSVCKPESRGASKTTSIFHAVKGKKGSQLSAYVLRMTGYITITSVWGIPRELGLDVRLILSVYSRSSEQYPLTSAKNKRSCFTCLLELDKSGKVKKPTYRDPQRLDGTKIMGNGQHKHALCSKPKILPPPEDGRSAKDLNCHECVQKQLFSNVLLDYALETAARILNMGFQLRRLQKDTIRGASVKRSSLTKLTKLEPGYYEYLHRIPKGSNWDIFLTTHREKVLTRRHNRSYVFVRRCGGTMSLGIGEPANIKLHGVFDVSLITGITNSECGNAKSMKDNEVLILVELPPNGKNVGAGGL
ncbi:hypothetical protein Tco_0132894 [Tanacetum coccineum]